MSPETIQVITNIIYGTLAMALGLVTIYQAYRAYSMWQEYSQGRAQGSREIGTFTGYQEQLMPGLTMISGHRTWLFYNHIL